MQRVRAGRGGQVRVALAQLPQPGESRPASRAWAMPRTSAPAAGHRGDQPGGAGPHQISADRDRQRRTERAGQRPRAGRPRAATGRGSRASPRPAASAPLASHRSCQVCAGLVAQPVQQRRQPRDGAASGRRRCPATNGAPVSRSSTCSRSWLVAGHPAAGARGGNRALAGADTTGGAGAAAVHRRRSTSARSTAVLPRDVGDHDGRFPNSTSRRLGPVAGRRDRDALARRPAGSARRGGPAPGGPRPPCAGSGRSASWSAGRGRGRTAHRSAAGPGPRPSGRRRCGATSAASRVVPARGVDPLEHAVHRVIGQRPRRRAAASTTAGGSRPRGICSAISTW